MTGNVVIVEVVAVMYVVLSNAEKYVPYGEIVHQTMNAVEEVSVSPAEGVVCEFSHTYV
jgi:hypothetical protein